MRYGGDGESFTKGTKDKIYARQGGKCPDKMGCGKKMSRKEMQTHHTFAKSWGGSADSWNGVGLHRDCHNRITKNQKKSGSW